MPKLVALSTFRDKVREAGEFRDHYTNNVMLDSFINFSASKFYTMVATADPLYYSKTFYSAVTNGIYICDLPNDFWRVVGVEGYATHFDGSPVSDSYEVLESFRFEERKDAQYASTKAGTRWLVKGVKEGSNFAIDGYKAIILQPTPNWAGTLKIEYIPQYKDLDAPSDYMDTVNFIGFTWIVNDVAAQCCRREQMPEEASYIQARDEAEKVLIGAISMEAVEQKSTSTTNTLQALWRAVRNRGKWKREDVSDAQLTAWINGSMHAFTDLIAMYDPSYFLSTEYISVTSGDRLYSLPDGFYKCVGVSVVDAEAADGYTVLESFNWDERWEDTYTPTKTTTRYRIRGDYIEFSPTPNWTAAVRIDFLPTQDKLVNPTDTFTMYNGWEEWVILDVCMKVAAFMGPHDAAPPPDIYAAQQTKVEERIKNFAERDLTVQKTTSTQNNLQSLWRAIRNRGGWKRREITDTQLTAWINSSYKAFADFLARNDMSYFRTTSYITITNGVRLYDLPADFHKELGLAILDDTKPDGYSVMERFNRQERYDYAYISDKWSIRYDIIDDYIELQPTPRFNGTLQLDYIPTMTELVNPSDTYKRYNGWEEWVILDVCEKVSVLVGNPQLRQFFVEQRAVMESRIKSFSKRDRGRPRTVVDVNRWGKYDPRFWKWGNRGR